MAARVNIDHIKFFSSKPGCKHRPAESEGGANIFSSPHLPSSVFPQPLSTLCPPSYQQRLVCFASWLKLERHVRSSCSVPVDLLVDASAHASLFSLLIVLGAAVATDVVHDPSLFLFPNQSLFPSPRSPRWHLDGVNIRCCALPHRIFTHKAS
eukprot:g6949.t1